MGLMDTLKAKAEQAKVKAGDFVERHGDTIESKLDKVAHTVDEKTKHKYSSKIDSGVDKTKGALGQMKEKRD